MGGRGTTRCVYVHVLERRAAPVQGWGESRRGGKGGAAPAIIFFLLFSPRENSRKWGERMEEKRKEGERPPFPLFLRRRRRHLLKAPRGRKRGETQAKKGGGDVHDLSHVHKPPSQQVFSSPFPSARLFPVTNFPPREGERQKKI